MIRPKMAILFALRMYGIMKQRREKYDKRQNRKKEAF